MPAMERSVSLAERGTAYGGGATDLRSHSASYAPRLPPKKVMKRARSTACEVQRSGSVKSGDVWRSGSVKSGAVWRSGSVKSVSGGPTPGLNLRCYSASYTAGGGGQLSRSGSVTNWTAGSGRRSVNLRGYTPSFAALDDTAAPAKTPAVDDAAEMQRKKRLVVYKVYDVEGKLRSSVQRGFGWIKSRCSRVVFGWW